MTTEPTKDDAIPPRPRHTTLHTPLPPAPGVPPDETDSIPAPPKYLEESSRTRAARRAAELREHLGPAGHDESTDMYFIDPRAIPDGWSYEWKSRAVLGAPNPSYEVSLARRGWEAVPASRHPEMMPQNWSGNYIEREGQILMERPMEITDEAKAYEIRKARMQIHQREEGLSQAPAGTAERDNKGTPLIKVAKSYEAIPIPRE